MSERTCRNCFYQPECLDSHGLDSHGNDDWCGGWKGDTYKDMWERLGDKIATDGDIGGMAKTTILGWMGELETGKGASDE